MNLLTWQQQFIDSGKNCLWCDTGMGKSRVGGYILSQHKSGLIVCPAHLTNEWIQIGKENGIIITELTAEKDKINVPTDYFSVVSRNRVALYDLKIKKNIDILIIDEAHWFKNWKSQGWKEINKVSDMFTFSIAMTATFLTKNEIDLVAPTLLVSKKLREKYKKSFYNFAKENILFQKKWFGTKVIEIPFKLTTEGRNEILENFFITDYEKAGMKKPEMVMKKITFEITKEHQQILDTKELPKEDENLTENLKFSDLHQLLNCFSYETEKTYSMNAKIDILKSIIDNENGKGLVFYFFKQSRSILADFKGFVEYTGQECIETFEQSDNKIMFGNYKAFGEGIRFKGCDFIIEFDLIFDFSAVLQARGRLQYAGRKTVYRIYRLLPDCQQIEIIENNINFKNETAIKYKQIEVKSETKEKTEQEKIADFWSW